MNQPIDHLSALVVAGAAYEVRLVAEAGGTRPGKHPALVSLTFEDSLGRTIGTVPEGCAVSPLFGAFRYIGRPGQAGRVPCAVAVTAPEGAVRLHVGLHRWHAEALVVTRRPELALVPLPGQEAKQAAFMTPLLLWQAVQPAAPGQHHVVTLSLPALPRQPDRFALAALGFVDAEGRDLPVPGASLSEVVGPFRYLSVTETETGPRAEAGFRVPPGAAQMRLQVLRWKGEADAPPASVTLQPLHPGAGPDLSGAAAPEPGMAFALSAELAVHRAGPGPLAVADITFFDAGGAVLPTPAPVPGLARSEVSRDHGLLMARPDPDGTWGATCRAGLHFQPPPGAVRLEWRLRPADPAGRLDLAGPVRAGPVPAAPAGQVAALDPALRADRGVGEAVLAGLHAGLAAEASPWTALASLETALLAEAAGPVLAGSWTRFSARLHPSDPAQPGQVMITPLYADAAGRVLAPARLTGCTRTDHGGLCRLAVPVPAGADAPLLLAEDFLAPEGAVSLVVHVTHRARGGAPVRLSAPRLGDVLPDAVGAALAPERMSRLQAQCALQIADAVGHLPSRAALHRILAAFEAKPAGHTVRTGQLAAELTELDPGWLPDLPGLAAPPAGTPAPDPDSVLCLTPSLGQDDIGRRAVALAQARGKGTALCLPLQDRAPGAPPSQDHAPEDPEAPDGVLSEGPDARGVSRHRLRFAALQAFPERFSPTDRLALEARLFRQVLIARRAGMVQALSGPRGYDLALRGLALARAHDLPFVYERTGFHEHLWRATGPAGAGNTLTRLRLAREWQVMQAADAVIVPSEAMREALLGQGIAPGQVHVVPQGVAGLPSAEAAASEGPAPAPRLPGTLLIGHAPDPARPGAEALLRAALALLAPGRPGLRPVLLGAGPGAWPGVEGADPVAPPVLTGPLDEAARRRWLRACDLVVVPALADRASRDVPPLILLEALAAGVPVIAPGPPCAALTGVDMPRVPPDDPAALAGAIAAALKEPPPRAGRAALVQDAHGWDRAAEALDRALAAARAGHARRRPAPAATRQEV